MEKLRREWVLVGMVFASFLAGGHILLGAAWGGGRDVLQWGVVAGTLMVYILAHLWRNLEKNHLQGDGAGRLYSSLGLANWITLIRASGLAMLAGFLWLPRPAGVAEWIPGLLYLGSASLDYCDGWAARATRRTTLLGETLDMHWDGFGVLVATVLLIQYGVVPVWYGLVGLARYLFLFGMWVRTHIGLVNYPLPPSMARRALAGMQMGFIAVVLLPVFSPPATQGAATLFMLPLMGSFLRDWLAVCGLGQVWNEGGKSRVQNALNQLWKRIPYLLRVVMALNLAAVIWQETRSPAPLWWIVGGAGLGLLLVVLGVLGRTSAVGLILLSGLALKDNAMNGLFWGVLLIGLALMLTGTGRYSLWKADEWMIYNRAGEARPQG